MTPDTNTAFSRTLTSFGEAVPNLGIRLPAETGQLFADEFALGNRIYRF